MAIKNLFKKPTRVKVSNCITSIRRAFSSGIIPYVEPTEKEVKKVLDILHIDENNITCAYCGDGATQWDHFKPLINNSEPTGYITEISNLVPCCSICNSSKGKTDWKIWIKGSAPKSPTRRNIVKLEDKIMCLENFEKKINKNCVQLDFQSVIDKKDWDAYISSRKKLEDTIKEIQPLADKIQEKLNTYMGGKITNKR